MIDDIFNDNESNTFEESAAETAAFGEDWGQMWWESMMTTQVRLQFCQIMERLIMASFKS